MKTFYIKGISAITFLSLLLFFYCFIASAQSNSSNKIGPKAGTAFPFSIIDSTNVVPAHPVNTPITPYMPPPPDPVPPHTGKNQSAGTNDLALTNSNGKSTGGDPSGIDNNVLQATDLKIYPNPSDGKFTLQFNLNTEGEINIRLTDILGKEIISHKYEGLTNNYTDQFDLSGKGKGLYMLSIEQNNKQAVKKIVVN